jgi:hypothetical protein
MGSYKVSGVYCSAVVVIVVLAATAYSFIRLLNSAILASFSFLFLRVHFVDFKQS